MPHDTEEGIMESKRMRSLLSLIDGKGCCVAYSNVMIALLLLLDEKAEMVVNNRHAWVRVKTPYGWTDIEPQLKVSGRSDECKGKIYKGVVNPSERENVRIPKSAWRESENHLKYWENVK